MTHPTLRRALAGLQAGLQGTIVMIVWLMLGSLLHRRSPWQAPNLFASTFYGDITFRNGFFAWTWSGLALMVFIYGGLGIIWSVAWGERTRAFLTMYGAAAGLAVYFLFFRFIWPYVNPSLALYGPTRQLQITHVLWGMFLVRSRRFAARMPG